VTPGTASSRGLQQIAHHDLGGRGDGMQVMRHGDALYVGHHGTTGAGTSILDVSDPQQPVLVDQWPAPRGQHTHKVQVADGLLLVNHETFPITSPYDGDPDDLGLAVYRLDDPLAPERVGFWACGGRGVHRITFTGGRYAHMSATPPEHHDRIWVVVDLADPTAPHAVTRWWLRGATSGPPERGHFRAAAHHALLWDHRAFLGYDDAGMVVLDVSDWAAPVQLAEVSWGGGATHTCLPLPSAGVVVVTDEQVADGPGAESRRIRVLDGSTLDVLAQMPEPEGDFASLPLRFGPHNLHENRPASYRSDELVFATYFSAGVRVYDVTEPRAPVEIAHWVGEPVPGALASQANDLFVDEDGLIWVTDRVGGGLSVLEPDDDLAARMRAARA
jgi:hypothetical protein